MTGPSGPPRRQPCRSATSPGCSAPTPGHSTAAKSNELYRKNLAKGQTGLSIAFDLPTQTGYDADHELARGEVGKVGVPVSHLGDMRTLLAGIPLEQDEHVDDDQRHAPRGCSRSTSRWPTSRARTAAKLTGTIQNDIIKEYLSRGTYVFPPEPSLRLIKDTIVFTCRAMPKWNPTNVCSYHLQEAGATPVQELAFALATAQAVLDAVQGLGRGGAGRLRRRWSGASRSSSTPACGSSPRSARCAPSPSCGTRSRPSATACSDPKHRLFRYGVQVNSLGLTEPQAENNVYRILLEMLAVTLSRDARARAVQLPAWNEALGLPRPWDQQWSIRMQQILAYETDLLEYADIFEGSKVIRAQGRRAEGRGAGRSSTRIEAMGGAVAAIDYMKHALVESNTERVRRIEPGEQIVVGVNRWTETRSRRRCPPARAPIEAVDPGHRAGAGRAARGLARGARRQGGRRRRWPNSSARRSEGRNVMEPSIACAKAGVTTGEWGTTLRAVFGEYRAPTGIAGGVARIRGRPRRGARARSSACRRGSGGASSCWSASPASTATPTAPSRSRCGRAIAAWRWSTRASASRPAQIVRAAVEESVHVVGLSILSGSHVPLVAEVMERMRKEGLDDVPVVVGGIIPPEDAATLKAPRRRRRLHAQELPAQCHHARDRRPGGRPRRGGLRRRLGVHHIQVVGFGIGCFCPANLRPLMQRTIHQTRVATITAAPMTIIVRTTPITK